MSISPDEITIIIPTLNEEKAIGVLLRRLCELYEGINIIVVDDQSRDNTANVVNNFSTGKSVELLVRTNASIRGITASVLDAFRTVKTDYFLVMDGDLQHPPEVVKDIVKQLSAGADFVSAARNSTIIPQPLHRVIVTWLSTSIAKLVLRRKGVRITDPMSGMFAAKTSLVANILDKSSQRFELAGYKVMFDLLRCLDPSTNIKEVYYDFGKRSNGGSKLRPVHAFYFLRSVVK